MCSFSVCFWSSFLTFYPLYSNHYKTRYIYKRYTDSSWFENEHAVYILDGLLYILCSGYKVVQSRHVIAKCIPSNMFGCTESIDMTIHEVQRYRLFIETAGCIYVRAGVWNEEMSRSCWFCCCLVIWN